MATISLGMIVRNEGRTLRALLESVAPHVDQVVIGLAGESTDNTLQILQGWNGELENRHPVTWFDIEWNENFSEARNLVLARCTGDYFLWLDGDDVLINGEKMREYIDQYPQVDAFYMGYDYARDENGLNTCFLIRERLVKRHSELPVDWQWKGEIHEVLIPAFESAIMPLQDIVVRHFKPENKHEPDRNLRILYRQLEEQEPNPDPRILAYLGAENAGRGELKEAIVHWQRFVRMSGWDEEKYQAQVKISHAWRALGNTQKALVAAYDSIQILPEWPDAYLAIAKAYSSEPLNNYRAALEFLKVAVSKPKPQTALIINPLEYTYEPSLMIANCYAQLQDWEMALRNYENAFTLKQEPVVAQQIEYLRREVEVEKVTQSFLHVREYLARHDEWLKVNQLFDSVPKFIEKHPTIREAWDRTMQQTAHIEEPQVMVDFYRNNPHWAPMDEERLLGADWLNYPRMAFALSVANKINAKRIIDWGCSDGFISIPLARETGAKITGLDLDPRCVSLANERAARLGVDATFKVGNIEEAPDYDDEDKYDLALFFEVLEHVIDPAATLERVEASSKHVAITTPYLAWENGEIGAWDRVEPKGHLRIFDLNDIEILLQSRGRIHNLYREPWGRSGWIFADYEVGTKHDKNVVIYAPGSLEEWGPRKLQQEGLGGSEIAAIRLAEEMFQLGHRTFVYNWIDEPGYYNGVCYRARENFSPEIRSDLCIAWRTPELADAAVNTGRLVLWMHDTDAGDRLTEQRAARFDAIVVLTEWHKQFMLQRYPFLDPDKLVVIGNGVDTERFSDPVDRKWNKIVYSSAPDRGLDVILEGIWPKVVEEVPEAELHVYYGWESFDRAASIPGYQFLQQFRYHLDMLFLKNRNVIQHGRVPQSRLARELQEASIWLYPTYFSETYCITAIEAQLAGAIPVTNRLAGLQETVKNGIDIPGDVRDPNVQTAYARAVIQLLKHRGDRSLHDRIKDNVPAWSWSSRALAWNNLFLEDSHARPSYPPRLAAVSNSDDSGSEETLPASV